MGDFHRGEQWAPGIYDYRGELHVDADEFIRGAGGDPLSPRDREAAVRTIARVCAEFGIDCLELEDGGEQR